MRKFSFLILILFAIDANVIQAQLAKDSWSMGIGFRYPRFVSINSKPLYSNYGGFLSIQRNYSEHIGLRMKANFSHLESEYVNPSFFNMVESTDAITADLDLLFYLVPCEPISPYIFGGFGGVYKMLTNKATTGLDDNTFNYQLNTGMGLEFNLDDEWKMLFELGYHITNNSEFDGALNVTGVRERDTYTAINLGLLYFLYKGQPSNYCQLYQGITQESKDMTDYDRIEEMIKRHIPQEVIKEVVVEKPIKSTTEKWVLIGVNFNFNSAKLSAESYPILYDAAKTLLNNPELKVEIQGYTDNVGSESYNRDLAQKRADVVKRYFISKGIAANRLKSIGYGESSPVADNKTTDGRAMNRRIEFKVQ